jgi:hypothetical protein
MLLLHAVLNCEAGLLTRIHTGSADYGWDADCVGDLMMELTDL